MPNRRWRMPPAHYLRRLNDEGTAGRRARCARFAALCSAHPPAHPGQAAQWGALAARDARGADRGGRGGGRSGPRRVHRAGTRASAQCAELRRAPGVGRHGAALGHPCGRHHGRPRRSGRHHARRDAHPAPGLSRQSRRRGRHGPHQGPAAVLGQRRRVQARAADPRDPVRPALDARPRPAVADARYRRAHGDRGRRVRRHRRPGHHRGPGRGDRRRDPGRARQDPAAADHRGARRGARGRRPGRGRGAGAPPRPDLAGGGTARGRGHLGRADLHAARPRPGARRGRAPSGRHRVRGARGGSAPHQEAAHHPPGSGGGRRPGVRSDAAVATVAGRWLGRIRAHPRLAALVLGALAALALPPFHLYPALLAFAGLLDLLRRTERRIAAFVLGWCFGFAHFLLGLYWIAIAFFTDAERFGAFALPAVVLLCAYLAFYPALAAWLTVLHRWRSPTAAALVLALAWTAGEALRSIAFGGFPWNLIGYAFAQPIALSQLAALTGIWGLSLLAVALGALPVVVLERGERATWQPLAVAAAILAAVWLGGALRLPDGAARPTDGVHLRLVQGNIAQQQKWQPEGRRLAFDRHLTLSAESRDGITHVIWPESAAPYPLEQDGVAREMIAEVVPPGGLLLTGGERFDLSGEPPLAWNSLFVLDGTGAILARYDK